jgi:hypothetical protein
MVVNSLDIVWFGGNLQHWLLEITITKELSFSSLTVTQLCQDLHRCKSHSFWFSCMYSRQPWDTDQTEKLT